MDLKRLEYFCAIIEKGQITKAAKSLHISQPPLSQRLKELEEELGVVLVHRRGKEWQVTPEGQWFYQKAQFILSYIEGVKNDITSLSGELHGLVRIGICPPCRRVASQVLTELTAAHPRMRFRTWVMDNQSLERHLQENHLDFAIVLLPVTSAQYTFHNLRPKPYYAVYGRGMPAPLTPSVKLQDLAGLPLVVQQRRDYAGGMKSLLLKIFQKNSNHPRIVLETQDTSFLRQLLREGFPAVGILNEYEVKGTGMESLPTARVDEESLSLTASIITLRDAYISVAAQKVIETVLEKF